MEHAGATYTVWSDQMEDYNPEYRQYAAFEFVNIAPNLAIRPYYSIHAIEDKLRARIDIELKYDEIEKKLVIITCKFSSPRFTDGLKVSDIHKIPLEKLIQNFMPEMYGYDDDGYFGMLPWESIIKKVPFDTLRENGPVEDTLRWVARVYYVAQIFRIPATKEVSEKFGIPLRTASHWVKLMNERVRQIDIFNSEFDTLTFQAESWLPDEEAAERFLHATGL